MATVALLMTGTFARGARAQDIGTPAGDAVFSAEVSVERALVDDRGRVTRELPASRYLMERRADGRLRLTMRATRANPASGPLADPYAGLVVDTGDDGELRLLGRDGKPLPGVRPVPGPFLAPGTGDDSLVALAKDAAARRTRNTDAFGRRVGTVRGMDRHVVKHGDAVEEVLVSPRFALPVEINVVRSGALSERHEYRYEERPDGQIVRTRARSEARVGTTGERVVSITTLTDVRSSGGAR